MTPSKRTAPKELLLHGKTRTELALNELARAVHNIEQAIKEGRRPLKDHVTLKELCNAAGLHEKFLNGKVHTKTRAGYTQIVAELNLSLSQQERAVSARTEPTDDAAYWRAKYQKLAQHAHAWFSEMRELRRANRELLDRGKSHPVVLRSKR